MKAPGTAGPDGARGIHDSSHSARTIPGPPGGAPEDPLQGGQSRRTRGAVPIEESGLDLIAAETEEVSADVQLLHRFIGQLDELNRALILLYLDGNSYDTIAEILGISTTNVATKIGRIKEKLRRGFADA